MKQPKYISICDHLLYLLLANSALLFLIIYPSIIQAKIVKGEGMSYWGENTSKKEACDLAEREAKNDALRKIGLERLNSNQIEVCIDSGDKANCELYQSTFNTISGGYIKDFVILEKKRGGIKENFCIVKIDADVFKYNGDHDQEFIVNANIGIFKKDNKNKLKFVDDTKRFFEGSNFVINGSLSKEAYVTILGWYPSVDKENYYKLYPNKHDMNNLLNESFFIPNKEKYKKYGFNLSLPKNFKKNETQEFIIVLATKMKFAILDKIDIKELSIRLNDIGKSNWIMKNIGYSILRKN